MSFDYNKQIGLIKCKDTPAPPKLESRIYCIVRFRRDPNRKARVIKRGVTKKEAQAHCLDPKTEGKDWFDGWSKTEDWI